jgi:outer membrane protein W
MTRIVIVVAALVAGSATGAGAQPWELSGLAGYTPSVDLEHHAPEVDNVAIGDGFTWAFQAARFFTPHWGAEVLWAEQPSSYDLTVSGETAEIFSMSASQLHGNVVYQFGSSDARVRPFVFGGLGATFFRGDDVPSESKLSFGLGGGVKVFPWQTVGLRAHVRYKPTWLDDEDSDFCDPFGFCQAFLRQFELAGGVVLRF